MPFCQPDDVLAYADLLALTAQEMKVLDRATQAQLRQLRMQSHFQVMEVLDEICIRRTKTIEAGNVIRAPLAWAKKTGFHYLLGEKAKLDKAFAYAPEIIAEKATVDGPDLDDSTVYLSVGAIAPKYLRFALEQLEPEQRRVFELKYLHNFSWKEIVGRLQEQEPNLTEIAARKRGSELKKRLRKLVLEQLTDADQL
ncbi:MAG: sigma factor-like helix-turn-helix DNA-binding protein [Cyanobacteria bacterium P01_D01_bin.56]